MVITFQEKDNTKYEIDNVDTDKIFEETKENILRDLEKHKTDDCDLITTVFSYGAIIEELKQSLSNKYGADKIIKIIGAKPINKTEVNN